MLKYNLTKTLFQDMRDCKITYNSNKNCGYCKILLKARGIKRFLICGTSLIKNNNSFEESLFIIKKIYNLITFKN